MKKEKTMFKKNSLFNSSQAETDRLNPFGIIHCPGCELSWMLEFVPEYCPRCGAKVTDPSAIPMDEIVSYAKRQNLSIDVSKCLYCQKENFGTPNHWNNSCPNCGGEMQLVHQKQNAFLSGPIKVLKSIFGI